MTQIITATFEDGVLKPQERLDLPAGTKVRLIVELNTEATRSQEALAFLEETCDTFPIDSRGVRLTRDELHERR